MPKAVSKQVDITKNSSEKLAGNLFEDRKWFYDVEREANFYVVNYAVHVALAFHCDQNSQVFTWDVIYEFCEVLLHKTPFALFKIRNWKPGRLQPRSDSSASPGVYLLLKPDGSKLEFSTFGYPIGDLIGDVSDTCAEQVRSRDKLCLISGTKVTTPNKLEFTVVNILTPYRRLWERLSIKGLVTDPRADLESDNIQTVQNALLLRHDIAAAWAKGEIIVDAKRGHAIMTFKKKWHFLHGQKLHLEHLRGHSESTPLDVCFEEHKRVSIMSHVYG